MATRINITVTRIDYGRKEIKYHFDKIRTVIDLEYNQSRTTTHNIVRDSLIKKY